MRCRHGEITTVDVGNPTENMIPETARARFNVRFNVAHSGASLTEWLEGILDDARQGFDGEIDVKIRDILQDATETVTGRRPELSTSGGTSDARFITNYAPVAEFGLVGATMHQINERVDVADITTLTAIYKDVLKRYFA